MWQRFTERARRTVFFASGTTRSVNFKTESVREGLGDYMIRKGYASAQEVEDAKKAQQSTKGDLAKILVDLGLNPTHVYEAKATELGQPFVDLSVYKPHQSALNVVPEHVAKRHNVLPVKKDGQILYVAMADTNNIQAADDLRLVSHCTVRGVLAVPDHITAAIPRAYANAGSAEPGIAEAEAELDALEKRYGVGAKVSDSRRAVWPEDTLTALIKADQTGWRGRSLVTLWDVSPEQIRAVLETAATFKAMRQQKRFVFFSYPKTLALLFEKPSLRTRVSFEAGMAHLDGHAIYLAPADVGLGVRESVADVAGGLSRWVDVIAARTFKHETVEELAANATVPVINALSDREHPIQAFADLLAIREAKGELGNNLKLAYVGDGNNVLHSLLLACAKVGVNVTAACPQGYEPDATYVAEAQRIGSGENGTGAQIDVVTDPVAAVKDADVIYTDVWTSMGQEKETKQRLQVFAPYQVNAALLAAAKSDVIVLHCLPAHREEEITGEVMDAFKPTLQNQAENRLHTQKALIALMVGL